ncbi:hypothetical protein VKT23_014262 [Stygiomarasmius scandens]|uniref:Heterokaryon incompatibility domain-containing protein n=1 Tax=Marasmiellus scandens TaxID=2682957 RepID=A0ABR1J3R5_9AGAR
MTGFTAPEEDGWGQGRTADSLIWHSARSPKGMVQLAYYALDDLKERGWCKSELGLLMEDDLAFASLLSRPRIRDHKNCRGVLCDAYQTNEATYKARHVEDQCNCGFVEVPSDLLTCALSKKMIPKIIITEELELQVKSERDYPYIAISHVWADGLGNAVSNALPRCQLRRLRDYANALNHTLNPTSPSPATSPVALWMDTLCVPVHPDAKAYRKEAILLLGETFSKATAVLVLDRELEIVESTSTAFLELALRIICSGWMKRLWTLQEATLAGETQGSDKLYFQMRDGPFLYQKNDQDRKSMGEGKGEVEIDSEERSFLRDEAVIGTLREQVPSMQAIRNKRAPFQNIYDAIQFRSTSKSEDVPVCITSLLGHDPSTTISALDVERRMANFYMLMREVPCGVAWVPTAEKLGIRPFRWAPKHITSCSKIEWVSAWEDGICDAAGLHVRASGFIFAESEMQRHGLGSALPTVFRMAYEDSGDMADQLLWPQLRQGQDAASEIPLQRGLALIFRPLWSPPDVLAQSDEIPERNDVIAVVIEDTVNSACGDNGTHSPEYVCRIVGFLSGEQLVDASEVGLRCGYTTADDQRWCLT